MVLVIFLFLLLQQYSFLSEGLKYSNDSLLQNITDSFIGEHENDSFGYSLSDAGDVNGDGLNDYLIGSYLANGISPNAGKIYLFFGSSHGLGPNTSASNADVVFMGNIENSTAGFSVSGIGDINGDGLDDILIGAPFIPSQPTQPGRAYLILGRRAGWNATMDLNASDSSFIGRLGPSGSPPGQEWDGAGWSVSGAGDVNGDGYDDFLISAPFDDEKGNSGAIYLFFGRKDVWTNDTSLEEADAIFFGDELTWSGFSVSHAGDVNGDGFDDIIIGATGGMTKGVRTGKVYLIFGKASGWSKAEDLEGAGPSFYGTNYSDRNWSEAGWAVSGAGDVNGDGLDDFLIGAPGIPLGTYGNGCYPGDIYLLLGKRFWEWKEQDLSFSDTRFHGEGSCDKLGISVSGAGDVNSDGYDDMLFGAYRNDQRGYPAGKAYLELGKKDFPKGSFIISTADASFMGEYENDWAGWAVSSAGDTDGDGMDDILIGAPGSNHTAPWTGKAYLIFPDHNARPTSIKSIGYFADPDCKRRLSETNISDTVYIQAEGLDGNPNGINIAQVALMSNHTDHFGIRLRLTETGKYTGVYRGLFKVELLTHASHGWIGARPGEYLIARSMESPSVEAHLPVWNLTIVTSDVVAVNEDQEYHVRYNVNCDPDDVHWNLVTNATSWLVWNSTSHILSGIPNNGDVGKYRISLKVKQTFGGLNFIYARDFILEVRNVVPVILTHPITSIVKNLEYRVDFNSTDDGQGSITWHLVTNASWLRMNMTTGLLIGTPLNNNYGYYEVNVSVNDGNGGLAWTAYEITVVNNPPHIMSDPVLEAMVGYNYAYDVQAFDQDAEEILRYSLNKAPEGMQIDPSSGLVTWTPGQGQEGRYTVSIDVSDPQASVGQVFELTVHPSLMVTIDFPSEGQKVKGTFKAFGIAQGPEDLKVEVVIDGGGSVAAQGNHTWSCNINTTTLKDGKHVLRVRVSYRDNWSKETNVTFQVDNRNHGVLVDGRIMGMVILLLLVAALVLLLTGIKGTEHGPQEIEKKHHGKNYKDRTGRPRPRTRVRRGKPS
jgi:hypothetical protein